jgi:hypothetical protein
MEQFKIENELSTEIVGWLEKMKLDRYENVFNEALLAIPIAKYFLDHGYKVEGETDYHFINMKSSEPAAVKRGQINYDFYAVKGIESSGEKVIVEMKWMKTKTQKKKGSANYARLVTDFVKLAIPTTGISKRIAVIALDPDLPKPSYKWFSQLMEGKQLSLIIEQTNHDGSIDRTTKSSVSIATPDLSEFVFNDQAERRRIYNQLETCKIPKLELVVKSAPLGPPNGSVRVMVLAIKREASVI